MISAGRLRFQAQAKREGNTDNTGKRKKDFGTSLGYFRCDLRDTSATEFDYADGPASSNTFDVLARWDAIDDVGLMTRDILLINGRTFNVLGIRNDAMRNRLATITVEEIV